MQQCWDHYVTHHLQQTCDPATNMRRWNQLGWFAELDAERLSPKEVEAYIRFRGVGPATVNRELALLRAALRHAHRHGLIDRAPHVYTEPGATAKLRALSVEEAAQLVASATDWREQVYVRLALGTGARPGAISDLTWGQVLAEAIDFRKPEGNRRMKRRAVVPINMMVRQGLDIAYAHQSGPYVLHWQGAKLSSPRPLMARLTKRAGIKDCSPHVLRHTVASFLLASGEDLIKVSRLLGHASTTITEQVYFQHPPTWLKNTTDRLAF